MHTLNALASVAFAAATLVVAQTSSNTSSSNPIVDLGYARYQGVTNSTIGITKYYGLRYAAPPTGSLRWQPPIAIENATALQNSGSQAINATVPGPQCVQSAPLWVANLAQFGGIPPSTQVQSEDCLRLDVIVPTAPISSSLPVVVQIHGGGYTLGSSLLNDGTQFTAYSNGSVVYVQIQYRLGFYGFLNSRAVRANGTANAGLLDQRAALLWVRRHVSKFGGDPNKVTIWGGSAGGGSVTAQMQLYGGSTNPPFRAAIPEYPWWQQFHADAVLESQYTDILKASNCTNLACLRNLSASALVQANQQTYILGYAAGKYGYGDFYAGPSVDGDIIRDLPSTAFKTGRFSKVALLVDRDGFEGAIFTNASLTTQAEVRPDLATLWQTNSTSYFTRLFQLYPSSAFSGSFFQSNPFFATLASIVNSTANNTPYWQTQTIFGDFIINCPTYYVASALSDAAQKVYKLVFSAGSEVHGATALFLILANGETPNATLAAQMKSYWLGFVVNLDPNSGVGGGAGAARPNWPVYLNNTGGTSQGGTFNILSINQTAIGVRPDPDASDRCDFFHGQSYIVRN